MLPAAAPPLSRALAADGAITSLLRASFPDALALYAFGSRVQGTASAESDLDLAVLVPGYVPPLTLWNLSGQLADIAGCAVDLLDLRAASTVMQYQVITTGVRLWAVQPAADLFETYVLSEKTALDEARAGLLAEIAQKGQIYGG